MNYLLDTNICIFLFRDKFGLQQRINEVGLSNCSISEITIAELIYGAKKSVQPEKNIDLIEKFLLQVKVFPISSSLYLYAEEKARLSRSGELISDFDLLIGCTAIRQNSILVTENIKEFKRLRHLQIENWVNRN
jgi:tRNA(fMet)-specific endonuclease VapC